MVISIFEILGIVVSMFLLFQMPIFLGVILFLVSLFLVMMLNIFFNSWYSLILFLVYVGGLLVLFIYMCMMSSNEKFDFGASFWFFFGVVFSFFFSEKMPFLGFSKFESSMMLEMSMFMGMVILLLVTFLSVMRIVKTKSSLLLN